MTAAAVVTGAGGGIGAAIARRLATAGRPVACLDIDGEGANGLANALTRDGCDARSFVCDVRDRADVFESLAEVERWQPIGAVVSNAGILVRKGLDATSADEWDAVMAVNARGGFFVAQAAVAAITRAGGGSLVFTASVVAHVGFGLPAYTASKGALVALTRELAGEVAHLGVRVNAVSPGTVVGTGITRDSLADGEVMTRTVSAVPLGRLATVEDVAAAVAFLVSEDAAMITGQVLVVDGGMSASVYSMQRPVSP